jgi:hypothetical protein
MALGNLLRDVNILRIEWPGDIHHLWLLWLHDLGWMQIEWPPLLVVRNWLRLLRRHRLI